MKSFRAAIFDLDGTLAYTLPDLQYSMNEMLRANGFPEMDDNGILKAINSGAVEFVRRCLPAEYRSDESFVHDRFVEYTAVYEKHYIDKTVLYDGIAEALDFLKKDGMLLACFSNKQDDHVRAILDTLLPENTFDFILGQTSLPTKPHPIGAFWVAGELDCRPSEIAYIGDSDVDMMTACNAHMFPVGVSWGYRDESILASSGAKLIVRRPSQLVSLIAL